MTITRVMFTRLKRILRGKYASQILVLEHRNLASELCKLSFMQRCLSIFQKRLSKLLYFTRLFSIVNSKIRQGNNYSCKLAALFRHNHDKNDFNRKSVQENENIIYLLLYPFLSREINAYSEYPTRMYILSISEGSLVQL